MFRIDLLDDFYRRHVQNSPRTQDIRSAQMFLLMYSLPRRIKQYKLHYDLFLRYKIPILLAIVDHNRDLTRAAQVALTRGGLELSRK